MLNSDKRLKYSGSEEKMYILVVMAVWNREEWFNLL
jgi:hypothetical protein